MKTESEAESVLSFPMNAMDAGAPESLASPFFPLVLPPPGAPPGVSVPRFAETEEEALARARSPRVVPTLHVVDGTPRVEHFASAVAPRVEKPSVFDPTWRARPVLETTPALGVPEAITNVPPVLLDAMQVRERRSIFIPVQKAPLGPVGTPLSVPRVGIDPSPVCARHVADGTPIHDGDAHHCGARVAQRVMGIGADHGAVRVSMGRRTAHWS